MIDLVLNDLSLSLEDGWSVLMIGDLRRTPIVKVATNGIRYEVKGATLGMVTLIMKCSQRLDPWADRSEGLIETVTWSQNPRTIWVRTLQVEGVREPLRIPRVTTEGRGGAIDGGEMTIPHWGGRIVGGGSEGLLRRHS